MEDKNISNIINQVILINNNLNAKIIVKVLKDIENSILINYEKFREVNKIDLKNHNGFPLDKNIITNIFKNLQKENIIYGKVITSNKDETKIYGKEYLNRGNVLIFNEGNFYCLLEIFLKNFLVGNTSIIVSNGYMYGSNNLLVTIIKEVLKSNDLSPDYLNLFVTDDSSKVLEEYANIDLNIVIGPRDYQRSIIEKSKVPVLTSGYLNYDIYIDEIINAEFIKKILSLGLNLTIYLKEDINMDIDAIKVSGLEEAIKMINYNGSLYASSIFTSDSKKASQFIRNVKSKMISVNASPNIEELMDIKVSDLSLEKTICYPR